MKTSVLIVEDDKLLAEVYQKSLIAEGLDVLVAYDSKKALTIFANNSIGLVVLDIVLGDSNGFEFLKQFRKHAGTQRIPIVIVTGLNTDEVGLNKELSVSLNIIGIYTKSQFAVSKLVEVVKYGLKNNESA